MSDNKSNAKGKEDTSYLGTALAVIGVIGAIAGLFSGADRKTMKAPGKDGRIFRDAFESDPKNSLANIAGTVVNYVGTARPIVNTAIDVFNVVKAVVIAETKSLSVITNKTMKDPNFE
ncbi:unnamed protein product [Microthlaspi erraticum]|uniref:Uncharacterized protein n=1 Tax=Microthlaspi erraticum TaxID=1685480 RepID=A0A6D2KDH0_9BRAS|nr:unnamed protein product [Microthlaspi erraticum]